MRISGVPVGKVKTIEPDKETGRSRRRDPARVALRAAALGREGDPAPEDAAGRDLRRAHAGHARRRRRSPRAGRCRPRRSRRHGRARRDLPRVRPEHARGVPGLDADAGAGDRRPRPATSTTRSATSRRSPRTRATLVDDPQPPGGRGRARLIANTGVVFGALTERDGQLRSLIENSNTRVRDHRGARPASCRQTFRGAADVRGRVAPDAQAARPQFADDDRTRWSPSCGRRRAS